MSTTRRTVCIVTGGAQGIGRAIVGRLLAQDHCVAVFDNDEEAREQLVRAWGSERLLAFDCDVKDESSVRHAIEGVVATYGFIDGLVNNAALSDPYNPPIESLSLEDWERVLRTNLTGAFLSSKHAAPHLRRSGRGAIVNIASTRALQSEPNQEAYAASKGGLLSLTHALAVSLGPQVRVNAVTPGWIDVSEWKKRSVRAPSNLREVDHRQHPSGRVGKPEDVASITTYLLSTEARFVTGQSFVIDGGMTRKMLYVD